MPASRPTRGMLMPPRSRRCSELPCDLLRDRLGPEVCSPGRVVTSPGPAAAAADLDALTGIRSSKRNYYPEYRRSAERLERAVRALDAISWALGRTVEGPRPVLEAVVHAACDHMRAQWTLLALARGALPESRPRFLVLDPGGRMIDRVDDLPEALVG